MDIGTEREFRYTYNERYDNVPAKVVTVLPWHYMMNLHSIFCKVDANSNKLFVLLEPHSSFRFQYRLLAMATFFEIALQGCRQDFPLGGGEGPSNCIYREMFTFTRQTVTYQ